MKYLIISVLVTAMTLLMHMPDMPSDSGVTANRRQSEICLRNISAGNPCSDTAQVQQTFVLVRGQTLPL
ncbi:MAG: hypothetical protein ACAH05_02130 [Methylophilus sp.]